MDPWLSLGTFQAPQNMNCESIKGQSSLGRYQEIWGCIPLPPILFRMTWKEEKTKTHDRE